jgi:nicotinamide-nucleotide amidase
MTAYLLTVGDEILIGQITDTNSAWMAQQLNLQGIRVVGKSSVGDVHTEIVEAIGYALSKADVVLMTGGLGATKDDITKKAIADFLEVEMVWSQETYDRTEAVFKKFNRTVSEMNRQACYMPDTATLLMNNRGLAPAMWFDARSQFENPSPLTLAYSKPHPEHALRFVKNTEGVEKHYILISMPGVPHEMQHLMADRVLPKLKAEFPSSPIVHRTILTAGEGETMLAEKLGDFENDLPDHVKLAYLPHSTGRR